MREAQMDRRRRQGTVLCLLYSILQTAATRLTISAASFLDGSHPNPDV